MKSAFKLCPFCKEQIREEAVKCRFCGEWLEPTEPDSARKLTTAGPVQPSPTPPQESINPNLTKAVGRALDETERRQQPANRQKPKQPVHELPPRNPNVFFPRSLARKQYVIRWLILFAVVVAAMLWFVGAPQGTAVEIAGIVFLIVAVSAFIYNIFGLSIPRLRNAQIPLWALLLFLIPGGPLLMFLVCVIARENDSLPANPVLTPPIPPQKSIEPNAAKPVARALDDYDSRQSAPTKVDDKNKTKPTVSATKGTGTKSIWRVVVGALLMGGTYNSLNNFQQTYPTDLSYNITFFTLGFLFAAVGAWLVVSYLRPRKGYGLLVLLLVCAISAGSFAGFLKVRSAKARSESNEQFGR